MSAPRTGRLAGLLVVPLLVLGPFSLMHVPSLVHVPGDPAATAQALALHADTFRWGLLGELGIAFTEVGMIVVLHQLFRHAGEGLSLAAALARALMVALMGMSIVAGLTALAAGPDAPDLVALLMALRDGIGATWEAFFALHLLLLAPLVARSGRVPWVLGPLVAVGGLGYAVNAVAHFALPELVPVAEVVVAVTAMAGELPLFLWLLVRGAAPVAVASPPRAPLAVASSPAA